jgi:HPt (histidine-containing phosphotransfer) domain-containing protein
LYWYHVLFDTLKVWNYCRHNVLNIKNMAHTLKGSASTLMFTDIAQKAEALQFTIDESAFDRIPALIQELKVALKSV